MKKFLCLIFCFVLIGVQAFAQSATVTPSSTTYSTAGGQISFDVVINFPPSAATVGFSATPLAAGWTYVSTSGGTGQVAPEIGTNLVNGQAYSMFGFAYLDSAVLATGNITFSFVLSYPAGMSGPQTIDLSAYYRNGSVITIAIPSIVLQPLPPPVITKQAFSQATTTGGSAVFTIAATGTPVPTYQWYFTPSGGGSAQTLADVSGKLSGTHGNSLTVSNVQTTDVGDYVCVATNTGGSTTGTAAQLTLATRVVRVSPVTANPGATVVVPVQLVAHGEENALGASLVFDPAVLTYQSAALGSAAADGTLNTNASQSAGGRVGFALAKPAGVAWAAGTQEVIKVTFLVNASAATGSITTIGFGSTPVAQEVASVIAATLAAGYQPATLTIADGYEADMNGNGAVTITDWVKIGRIVAGLDPAPTGSDFMKADCAPRSTLGNGALTVSDWVQAGRYAAGLDPLTPVGGPSSP